MDTFGMLIWAAVLVSLIVFIVLLVKSYAAWGLLHTIVLSILFIECWTFVFLSANVSYQRLAYLKAMDKVTKRVADLQLKVDEAMFGSRIDPNLDLQKFVPLSNELYRMTLERGRVWRGARKQSATATGAKIELPASVSNVPVSVPAGAANAAGAAAAPVVAATNQGLTADNVVYVFGERASPEGMLPKFYVGEFVVTEVKDNVISIRPTLALTEKQANEFIRGQYESWAIYEIVPLDSHTAFAAIGSKPADDSIFGAMKKEEIAALLEIDPALADASINTLQGPDARKARLLKDYLNDGGPAPDQSPPESVWTRVKFVKDYEDSNIDANSGESKDPNKSTGASTLDTGYFNANGLTLDPRLRRKEDSTGAIQPVRFKTGETYVLESRTATELEKAGVVTIVAPIFVRPLNDYEFGFRESKRLTTRSQQDLLLVNRELSEAIRTNKVTLDQESRKEQEGIQLKSDKSQYEKEAAVIAEVANALSEEINAKKSQLSQVYASIVNLHSRVVQRNQELSNQVNASQPVVE